MSISYNHRLVITILVLGFAIFAKSQQNRLMYHLYDLPESSLLNPAVPMPCGWVIGLPVVSSLHLNFGNNFLTPSKVLTDNGNGRYDLDYYNIEKYLHRRNFVLQEFHTQWLAVGLNKGNWSYLFTITEKSNMFSSVPRDMMTLMLHGNAGFIDEKPKLKGLGMNYNYYREYAFAVSKKTETGDYLGIRAKLLFGKLNAVTKKADLSLVTDNTTYDIALNGDVVVKTSMPVYYNIDLDNPSNEVIYDEEVSTRDVLMNRGNPGTAFDFGWIRPVDEQLTLSASVIDLGFIRWRTNNHNYYLNGEYYYSGLINNNATNIADDLRDSLHHTTTSSSYTTFLPTKLMTGANYQFLPKLSAGVMGDLQFYRTKWITGLTVSGAYQVFDDLKLVSSLSYQYNTLRNIGFGIVGGNSPIQFYVISDNVAAFFWPYGVRNINLRFGINIIPGCHTKTNSTNKKRPDIMSLDGNCTWANEHENKHLRKKK